MRKDQFIETALYYTEDLGFSIIPLKARDKRPALSSWVDYQKRIASKEEILSWADSSEELNIGIVTGSRSGIVVIDIDGAKGIESAEGLDIPKKDSPTATTGKGYHVYCAYPDGYVIDNGVGVYPGIDIRGNGGYVVAPPSTHPSGAEYTWLNDIGTSELQPLPEWVMLYFYKDYNKKTDTSQQGNSGSGDKVLPEGSRNDELFRCACRMRNAGVVKSAVLSALHEQNRMLCSPPLDDAEIEKMVDSCFKKHDPNKIIRPLTDAGNAERLMDKYNGTLRYVRALKSWYHFDGKSWVRDEGAIVADSVLQVVRNIPFEAPDDAEIRKEYNKFALKCESEGRLKAMTNLAENMMSLGYDKLDRDHWLFNVQNGTINLKTKEFREHSAEDFMTNISPVVYDPVAICPTWDKFLNDIFLGNKDLIYYMQKALGYALTGSGSEQAFFVLYGTGGNGKSTFIEVVRSILNSYAKKAEFSTFTTKFSDPNARNDVARLAGARFVSASESNPGKELDAALLKDLTGEEMVSARFLYKEHFEFMPTFKIFLLTNHQPRIKDDSDGIWRRMKQVPFNLKLKPHEIDRKLPEKLQRELPGIFNWMLAGCEAWINEGLGEVDVVTKATQEYRDDMDTLGKFIEERCDTGNSEAKVPRQHIYDSFKDWCHKNGEVPWSGKVFYKKLRERGYIEIKTNGGIFHNKGIQLYPQYQQPY